MRVSLAILSRAFGQPGTPRFFCNPKAASSVGDLPARNLSKAPAANRASFADGRAPFRSCLDSFFIRKRGCGSLRSGMSLLLLQLLAGGGGSVPVQIVNSEGPP